MELKIYKAVLLIMVFVLLAGLGFAQDTKTTPGKQETSSEKSGTLNLNMDLNLDHLDIAMNSLNIGLNDGLKDLNKDLNRYLNEDLNKNLNKSLKDLNADLKDLNKGLNDGLKDLNKNLNIDLKKNLIINFNNGNFDEKVTNSGIQDRVKNYSKTYTADGNDKLEISNKYGKVIVNTWNKNEFKVDVQIKAYAKDDEMVQKMVDNITISDRKDGDVVSFKTNFGDNNVSNSIWKLFSNMNNNHKVEVNYIIYMPSKNALDIDNRYGATELPDFEGKVSINSSYGSFAAKALTHSANEIRVHYGSADIESLSSCDLDVGYGSLELGSVDKLNANISYSSVKIGKIRNSAEINARYAGGVQIDDLDKNFTNFSVNASYSGVKIGLANTTNADFDITVHYGGFDYGGLPVDITKKSPSDSERGFHPTQNYKGHIGKGNAERTISIRSSYGGVTFE